MKFIFLFALFCLGFAHQGDFEDAIKNIIPIAKHFIGWGANRDSPMSILPRLAPARNRTGWKQFRSRFGRHRKFRNSSEEEFHARIFEESEAMVKAQNEKFARGKSGYRMALNQFADMTEAEYRARLPPIMTNDMNELQKHAIPFAQINHTFRQDSHGRRKRDVSWNYLTPTVKDQGQCGSCYAFAAVGALEAAIRQKTGIGYTLSEQDIVDCSAAQGNHGCNGGNMPNAFRYIQSAGINLAENYPYETALGTCRHNAAFNVNAKVTNHVLIGWPSPTGDEPALQQALNSVGPVSIIFNASPRSFGLYSGGVYDEPDCDINNLNHAVLIVGMGNLNGSPYYLVKNSWGTGWGDGGYIRMAAGKNLCGIARFASYPIVQ